MARGSAYPLDYSPKGEAETLGAVPNYVGAALGFRLVHDPADRVSNGGIWYYGAGNARTVSHYGNRPGFCSSSLGFRLVWEET